MFLRRPPARSGGLFGAPDLIRRVSTALTDIAVRSAKPRERDCKLADGGLNLLMTRPGGRLWRIKNRADGVERKLPFGEYPDITLAEACAASPPLGPNAVTSPDASDFAWIFAAAPLHAYAPDAPRPRRDDGTRDLAFAD